MANAKPMTDKLDDLSKVAAIAVTMTGRAPSTCTFQYTEENIREDVTKLLTALVPDIREVTLEVGNKASDHPEAFAWLPADSEHVIEKGSKQNNVIGKPIHSYSKALKELMDKYCPKDCKRLVSDATSNGRLLGIPLDLARVFRVLMDCDGNYAKTEYGTFVKSNLTLIPTYRQGDGNERGRLLYIEVTKSTSIRTARRPRPTKSMNY